MLCVCVDPLSPLLPLPPPVTACFIELNDKLLKTKTKIVPEPSDNELPVTVAAAAAVAAAEVSMGSSAIATRVTVISVGPTITLPATNLTVLVMRKCK